VFYVYKSEAKKQQNIILQLSRSIESNLPYSELDHLEQEPADLAKRSFSSLNDALQRTIKSTPSARFAYVYTERNGKLYFLADSEAKSSQAYSPAGQEYTEASTEYFKPVTTKKAWLIGPVTDRLGTWMSSVVPIFDPSTGDLVAVFGMDYEVSEWRMNILLHEIQSIALVFVVLFLVILLWRRKRKNDWLKEEINQRIKTEDNLRESQLSLANLVSNLPGLVYRCALDQDYTMEFISAACFHLTGYSPSDFISNRKIAFNDLILPEYKEYLWNQWQKSFKEGTIFEEEYRIQTASGEIKWVWERGKCVCDDQNNLLYLEGYIEDISNRKKVEKELKKLSLAIEQNPVSVMITNNEGIIEYCNPRFFEITGFDKQELLEQNPKILKSGKMPDEFYAELWQTITSGKIWSGEVINKNKKGEFYWESKSISPIVDEHGQITNFVAIGEDISERKKIEKELISAKEKAEESNRLKSAFLANISHEIRTPMNGIMGFTDLLKNSINLRQEEESEYLSLIFQSSKRLLEMLNNLIDISKIQSGEKNIHFADINLDRLMRSLYGEFSARAKMKNVEFKLSMEESESPISFISDREKLEKVLGCLLDNACKFTRDGQIEFGYSITDLTIQFFVRDTGIGISEDKQAVIFEIFRQGGGELNRKYEGAGLGLAIAKAFVEWLGGKLWLNSSVGQGALFVVEIPFRRNEVTATTLQEINAQNDFKNIHILIADDDEASRVLLEKSITGLVASISVATNGKEAIDFVRSDPRINLILMDLKMPVLNGFEATHAIKQEKPEIHIIAQTAFDEPEDQQKALEAGCSDIITKPINIRKLKSAIAQLIPVFFVLFFISCRPSNLSKEQQQKTSHIFESKGYVVPDDSMVAPEVSPAVVKKTFKIGKLPVNISKSNVHPAKDPVLLAIKNPEICTPGIGIFHQPTINQVVIRKKLCKEPEIVLAKDPYSKEKNPDNFVSFNKLQGLKHDQVREIIQDNVGNMWFATDEGLTRFDGKFFSHYSIKQGLTNSLVLSVFQDSKNNIWIGTFRGGITRYDGSYLTNISHKEGLINDIVNCVTEDSKGNIWIGTGGGLVMFNGEKFTNYTEQQGLCNNDVRNIFEDKDGKMWISTNKGGFSVFDGKTFVNYSAKQGIRSTSINCIIADKEKNIWIVTTKSGLIKYDGQSFYSYTTTEGLSTNELSCIAQDLNGNLWIGTMGMGVVKFDGKNFIYYTENEGISSGDVRCALTDRSGKLWFGTRGGGVARFEGETFIHLTGEQGLSNSRATKITIDRNKNIWIGTNGGYVTKMIRGKDSASSPLATTSWGSNEGIYGSRVYEIFEDKSGNIWFGSEGGGVACYDGKTVKVYTRESGLQSSSVRRIIQDRNGYFWIATYGAGLARFDGKSFVKYTTQQGLINNNIQSLLEDRQGRIWVGTDVGACSFDGKRFTHYKFENGLSSFPIYSMRNDSDGNVWFGTGGNGAICYDGKTFTHFTTDDGLSNNYVLSILEDSHRNMWFGTRSGPSILNLKDLKNWKDGSTHQLQFRNFDYEDGFLGIGCNYEALTEDPEGRIWIGANDRVSVFRGSLTARDTVPPIVAITKVDLFNEDIPWTGILQHKDTTITLDNGIKVEDLKFSKIAPWYNIPENPSFSYSNNYLSFNFIGIAQVQNKRLQYQVKLEGLDNDWGSLTKHTEASYGNLPAGSYVLKVRAVNSEGKWSKETSYPFIIRYPWWQTWWFYLFSFVFIAIGIFLYIQYRVHKINADKFRLQEQVDEQTIELVQKNEDIRSKNQELQLSNSAKDKLFAVIAHDVRGPISSFVSLTELLAEHIDSIDKQEIKQLIESMNTSSKNLYDLLSNLLEWSRMQRGTMNFNPLEVKFSPLAAKCITVVSSLAQSKNIELSTDVPEDITIFADEYMIASVIRNLLANAIKFTANGGQVVLKARFVNELETEFLVKDTGIGIPDKMLPNLFKLNKETGRFGTDGEPSTGLGLNLCKDFIDRNEGTIQVFSEVNQGSTFIVRLKSRTPQG
jgi:PAS domain S-box-containing protein